MKNVHFIQNLNEIEVDSLILFHSKIEAQIDKELQGAVSYNLERFLRPFWMTTNGKHPIPRVVLIEENEREIESYLIDKRVALAIENQKTEELAFELLKKKHVTEELFFICENPKEAQSKFQKYRAYLHGIDLAKKIIQAPANLMTPESVAAQCLDLKKEGVIVQVLHNKELQDVGAHALLAVGQGSPYGSKMVIMEWRGGHEPPLALVGKGICFDAGGINLKTEHLNEMKWDKAGAGVVIGIMDIVSRLKLPIHLVGVVVLSENMPDGKAIKPGDVIFSLGGKTIEIIDTDCEGRLALADGISYVQKYFAPKTLIDFGTLTLETFGALGGEYAGLFCNDPKLLKQLQRAGEKSGEKLWPLPLGEYYANQIRSKIADLKNSGVHRYGASSAAAEFLRAFVNPTLSWAHIDISGTSWKLDAPEEGVTAFGIQLIMEYLLAN